MGQRLCFPQLDADGVAIETLTVPNYFFNKTKKANDIYKEKWHTSAFKLKRK